MAAQRLGRVWQKLAAVGRAGAPSRWRGLPASRSRAYGGSGWGGGRSAWFQSGRAAVQRALATSPSSTLQAPNQQQEEDAIAAFFSKYNNWEQKGVPKNAGTATDEGFDLRNMHVLLKHLGDPHLSAPVVHVAGTKGKGSTATFITEMLRAAGLRVGTYTSPHVVTMRERISTGGGPIPVAALAALIERNQPKVEAAEAELQARPSHFEVLTALALTYFAEQRADAMVVEVGLGGVRDATNVFPPAGLASAVITTIDMDHLDALGGSLESLVRAKAGIMKEGRSVVLGTQVLPEAHAILRAAAAEHRAILLDCSEQMSVMARGVDHTNGEVREVCDLVQWADSDQPGLGDAETAALEHWSTGAPLQQAEARSAPSAGCAPAWSLAGVRLRLVGAHQRANAAAAVRAVLWLRAQEGFAVTDVHIREGLERAALPGRFQVVRGGVSAPGGEGLVVLDGAHTPAAAQTLAQTLNTVFPSSPMALVVAMANDKEHLGVMRGLSKARVSDAIFTQVNIAGSRVRAAPAELLKASWDSTHTKQVTVQVSNSLEEAMRIARTKVGPSGLVCVTGSLHATAAVLELLYE